MSSNQALIAIAVVIAWGVLVLALYASILKERRKLVQFAIDRQLTVQTEKPFLAYGSVQGIPIAIETLKRSVSNNAYYPITRFRATAAQRLPDSLLQRSSSNAMDMQGAPMGFRHMTTGDGAFDSMFRILVASEEAAQLWRNPTLRAAILAIGTSPKGTRVDDVRISAGEIWVSLTGTVTDHAELENALQIVMSLARPQGSAAGYRGWS